MKIPEKKRSRFRRRRTVPKKPASAKAASAKPTEEKTVPVKPEPGKPTVQQPLPEKPVPEKPSVPKKPSAPKTAAEMPVRNAAASEKPAAENSGRSAPSPVAKGFCIRRPLLWAALLAVLVLAALLCGRPLRNSWPQSELSGYFAAVQPDGRIDLNRADAAALRTLPGVGESRAAAILAWREEHGGFSCVEELLQIAGIGEKMLETLRDSVCVLPTE